MELEVLIQKADNRYELVVNPELDYPIDFSLFGEGTTVKDAMEDFYISLEDMHELYTDENKDFPTNLKFVFKFDLASFLEFYAKKLGYSSLEKIVGVNQSQLSQYVQGYRNPSRATVRKIEKGLHEFANEISQVHFV